MREPLNHLDDPGTNLGSQIPQQLFLLFDEIGRNPRAQPLPLARGGDQHRASIGGIRSLLHVSLSHQRIHYAAGCALIEKQTLRQRAQSQRAVLDQRFQRVALRHGDVVAADPITIAELVNADQVGDGGLEGLGIALKVSW